MVHRLLLNAYDQMSFKLLVVEYGICLFVVPSSEFLADDIRGHPVVYGKVLLKLD